MRLLLVGSAADRMRLRSRLADASLEIIGEFPTLMAARTSGLEVDAIVIAPADRPSESDAMVEPLTAREREVLDLLAEGLSNKAIAERLGISAQTVKFHVASIYGKLGATNRTEAVSRAVRRGLITL